MLVPMNCDENISLRYEAPRMHFQVASFEFLPCSGTTPHCSNQCGFAHPFELDTRGNTSGLRRVSRGGRAELQPAALHVRGRARYRHDDGLQDTGPMAPHSRVQSSQSSHIIGYMTTCRLFVRSGVFEVVVDVFHGDSGN